jgi:hypothetical protein
LKKVIVFGAGVVGVQYCQAVPADTQIVALADNNSKILTGGICGHAVVDPKDIPLYEYDKIIIAIDDLLPGRINHINDIIRQLLDLGVEYDAIQLQGIFVDKARTAFVNDLATVLREARVGGNVAECGVFRGIFAARINEAFHDRKLYLFDTFEGFDRRDISEERDEKSRQWLRANGEYYSGASEEITLLRCPNRDMIEVRRGYVPDTFAGLEDERFCFVNLDMDLYMPQLAALRFFAPRMVNGGVILLHDYFYLPLPGVKQAVDAFAKECEFFRLPIGDGKSIALTVFRCVSHRLPV